MKALSLAVLALALAGCSSAPEEVRGDVGMPGVVFQPAELRAAVGQRILWANNGTLAHTVTADDGAFDSGHLIPGQTWAHAFAAPGTYTYHCVPHSSRGATGAWEGMVGRVVVS